MGGNEEEEFQAFVPIGLDSSVVCSGLRLALRRLVEHSSHLHPVCFHFIAVELMTAILYLDDLEDLDAGA